MAELRLLNVMEQLYQVGEFMRGTKVPHEALLSMQTSLYARSHTLAPAGGTNGRDFTDEVAVFGRHQRHRLLRLRGIRLHERAHGRNV